jgi:hypothetical protein
METRTTPQGTKSAAQNRQRRIFNHLWSCWTARAHGRAYLHALLARALQQAQARVENPLWCERLRRWQARLTNQRQ